MKVRFQKAPIFPIDFDDFMLLRGELWITLGYFRVTFGVWERLWSYFRGTLVSLLACEGDCGVTLESLFAYDGDFVATLGSVCSHYWHLRAALGALSVTLGLLWEHLRHMGVPSGSLWGDFGISLESVWVSVGDITWWSLCNVCRVTLGILKGIFKWHSFSIQV